MTTDPAPVFPPPLSLASVADYELFIGPVLAADQPRLEALLPIASVVVYGKAYLLLSQDIQDGTTPIPQPATLVTCQVAANLMANPTGSAGIPAMERVGFVETQYEAGSSDALLPAGWKELLKPWRLPEFASVGLSTHLPPVGYLSYWWGWYWGDNPDPTDPFWDPQPTPWREGRIVAW
jgi:hypothetical protein